MEAAQTCDTAGYHLAYEIDEEAARYYFALYYGRLCLFAALSLYLFLSFSLLFSLEADTALSLSLSLTLSLSL